MNDSAAAGALRANQRNILTSTIREDTEHLGDDVTMSGELHLSFDSADGEIATKTLQSGDVAKIEITRNTAVTMTFTSNFD